MKYLALKQNREMKRMLSEINDIKDGSIKKTQADDQFEYRNNFMAGTSKLIQKLEDRERDNKLKEKQE